MTVVARHHRRGWSAEAPGKPPTPCYQSVIKKNLRAWTRWRPRRPQLGGTSSRLMIGDIFFQIEHVKCLTAVPTIRPAGHKIQPRPTSKSTICPYRFTTGSRHLKVLEVHRVQ